MRILMRADAGAARGTGHVMRCLTLAESLLLRGHEVVLAGRIGGVPWLQRHLDALDIPVHDVPTDSFDPGLLEQFEPNRVIVDSYWIEAAAISLINRSVPVLAIVDHDTRGIDASWFLDQNLGAEDRAWPESVRSRMLAGSKFALVRSAIARHRRVAGWQLPARPSVLAFMGGTDPFRYMTDVARSIASRLPDLDFIAVTTSEQVDAVNAATREMSRSRVLEPTQDLPALLGAADVVVSAAGTSAWDVLTMARPTVLVGVVDNQSDSLEIAIERGLALGIDAAKHEVSDVGDMLQRLLQDERLRERLVRAASAEFDGLGAQRVSEQLEESPSG